MDQKPTTNEKILSRRNKRRQRKLAKKQLLNLSKNAGGTPQSCSDSSDSDLSKQDSYIASEVAISKNQIEKSDTDSIKSDSEEVANPWGLQKRLNPFKKQSELLF